MKRTIYKTGMRKYKIQETRVIEARQNRVITGIIIIIITKTIIYIYIHIEPLTSIVYQRRGL